MTGDVRLYDNIGPNVLPWRGVHTLIFAVVAAIGAYILLYQHHRARTNKADTVVEIPENPVMPVTREAFEQEVDTILTHGSDRSNDVVMAKLYDSTCEFVGGRIGESLESVSANELQRYKSMLGKDVVVLLQTLYTPVFSQEERIDRKKIADEVKTVVYAFHQKTQNSSTSMNSLGE